MIFKSWFNEFAVDDPDVPGRKIFDRPACAAFARTCTDDYVTEEDIRVVGFFDTYDKDRDNKLTEEDFLDFYRTCTIEKEEVVRQNLFSHGYKYDLRKIIKDTDDEFVM